MQQSRFPSIDLALEDPNGLLAHGGDLSAETLLDAYSHGIFPWPSELDEGEYSLLWWSPNPREILIPDEFHISRSLQKTIKKTPLKITLNQRFGDVIRHCACIPRDTAALTGEHSAGSTWISDEMQDAYRELHSLGYAHSIEVWQDGLLAGGLYGVTVGNLFCGESMFHLKTDTSKIALLALSKHMQSIGWPFIDCQIENPHLRSLGSRSISRKAFAQYLPRPSNTAETEAIPPSEFKADNWRYSDTGMLLDGNPFGESSS